MIVEMVGPAIEFLAQPLSDQFGALNSHWWRPPPQANTIQPRSPKTCRSNSHEYTFSKPCRLH